MRISHFYVFLIVWLAFLSGCAPEDDNSPSARDDLALKGDAQYEYDQGYVEEYDNQGDDLPGWRKGTLKIKLEIDQSGQMEEAKQGGVTTIVWSTLIKAETQAPVMVAPNIQLTIDEHASEAERREFFRAEPYYYRDEAQYQTIGEVRHSLRLEEKSPNANDYTRLERLVEETGTVDDLSIQQMHPSLYGEGYTLALNATLDTSKRVKHSTQRAGSGAVNESEEQEHESQLLSFILHPVPNAESINNYPFWEQGTDQRMIELERQRHMEVLRLLQEIHALDVPALGEIRTGLVTELESGGIKFSYQYAGDLQPPFMAEIEGLATGYMTNGISITVLLDVGDQEN